MTLTKDLLYFKKHEKLVPIKSKQSNSTQDIPVDVVLNNDLEIPPYNEMEIMGTIRKWSVHKTWIVEGEKKVCNAAMVARAVVQPQGAQVPLRLLNPRDEVVNISKGTTIARMELLPVDSVTTVNKKVRGISRVTDAQCDNLWKIVNRSGDRLNLQQQDQLFALLLEYHDLFDEGRNDFGRTGKIKHRIDTGESPPFREPVRRIPPFHKCQAKELLREMLDKNVIKTSNSPLASPLVLVQKKYGTTRFCVDYQKVNAVTRKDAYPLPRVDDTLDTLAGSKWFSTLDLISGYWQVEMSPEHREKTAFCTTKGLFEFNVMPFGLCNAPATFQRLMDMVLAGLQWSSCLVYLDDIIVIGKTFEDHLMNLREVFKHLKEAGLKLKRNKCDLCMEQVKFLGHIVSAEGVQIDPEKTEKVAQWPQPFSKREVQQFLGLANYYRRFVKDFASINKPLHCLTEKTSKFDWTDDCQRAFEQLRQRLVTAPILVFPDFSLTFLLDTDASDIGIGAVLS